MIAWPKSLIRELASRRCILFLGAGISATARDDDGKSPPTWGAFLNETVSLLPTRTKRDAVKSLLSEGRYLIALQAIRDECNRADYRKLLDTNFNRRYKPSQIHQCVNQLDQRIVITTNFDKIYEDYCVKDEAAKSYKVINYNSSDFADEIRSDTRLIVKAHGSINEIKHMIFTKSEYHMAKKEHSQFYELLKALFITNTVVFLGCGLEDPDVMLLLEDVKIISGSEKPHYAVVNKKNNTLNNFHLKDLKEAYNIEVLRYGPSYEKLSEELEMLLNQVKIEREANPQI